MPRTRPEAEELSQGHTLPGSLPSESPPSGTASLAPTVLGDSPSPPCPCSADSLLPHLRGARTDRSSRLDSLFHVCLPKESVGDQGRPLHRPGVQQSRAWATAQTMVWRWAGHLRHPAVPSLACAWQSLCLSSVASHLGLRVTCKWSPGWALPSRTGEPLQPRPWGALHSSWLLSSGWRSGWWKLLLSSLLFLFLWLLVGFLALIQVTDKTSNYQAGASWRGQGGGQAAANCGGCAPGTRLRLSACKVGRQRYRLQKFLMRLDEAGLSCFRALGEEARWWQLWPRCRAFRPGSTCSMEGPVPQGVGRISAKLCGHHGP